MLQARDHHYFFAHEILRNYLWNGDSLFGILAVPENQEFLSDMWTHFGQSLLPEQRLPTDGIKHSSHWLGGNHLFFLIELPPALPPEAQFVAISTSPKIRYFTLEKGTPDKDHPDPFVFCEWTKEGQHLNYGYVERPDSDSFLKAICKKLSIPQTIEQPTRQQMQGMHKGPAIFDTTMPQELPTATNQQVSTWASDAEIAEKAGQLQKAEQLYKKILELRMIQQGPENTIATLAHRDLARVLMKQENFKEAKTICDTWWWYCRRYRMLGHAETMSATRSLARCLLAQGQHNEANELLAYRVLLGRLARGRDSLVDQQAREDQISLISGFFSQNIKKINNENNNKLNNKNDNIIDQNDNLKHDDHLKHDDQDMSGIFSKTFKNSYISNWIVWMWLVVEVIFDFSNENEFKLGYYDYLLHYNYFIYLIITLISVAVFFVSVRLRSWFLPTVGAGFVLNFLVCFLVSKLIFQGIPGSISIISMIVYFCAIFSFLKLSAKNIHEIINPLRNKQIPVRLFEAINEKYSPLKEINFFIWGVFLAGSVLTYSFVSFGDFTIFSFKWIGVVYSGLLFSGLILIVFAFYYMELRKSVFLIINTNNFSELNDAHNLKSLKKISNITYRSRWPIASLALIFVLLLVFIIPLRNEINARYIFEKYRTGPSDIKNKEAIELYIANVREIVFFGVVGKYSKELYRTWDDACFLLAKKFNYSHDYKNNTLYNCKEAPAYHLEEAEFINAENNLSRLDDFVVKYPQSIFFEDAKNQIKKILESKIPKYLSTINDDHSFNTFMSKFINKRKINVYFTLYKQEDIEKINQDIKLIAKPDEYISIDTLLSEQKIVAHELTIVSNLQKTFNQNELTRDIVNISLMNHIDFDYPSNKEMISLFSEPSIIISYNAQPFDKIKIEENQVLISMRFVFDVYLILPDGTEPLSFTLSVDPNVKDIDNFDTMNRSFEEISRALVSLFFSQQPIVEIDHFGPIKKSYELTSADLFREINIANDQIDKCNEKINRDKKIRISWNVAMDGHVENVKIADPKFQKGNFLKLSKCFEGIVLNLKFPPHNKPTVNMFYNF